MQGMREEEQSNMSPKWCLTPFLSSPRTEVKLLSTNPAVLTVGLAASLFATTVMFRNADEFADWSRQHLITFLGLDFIDIIVVLIIMTPPILVWAFCVHLLVLLWVRLEAWMAGRRRP